MVYKVRFRRAPSNWRSSLKKAPKKRQKEIEKQTTEGRERKPRNNSRDLTQALPRPFRPGSLHSEVKDSETSHHRNEFVLRQNPQNFERGVQYKGSQRQKDFKQLLLGRFPRVVAWGNKRQLDCPPGNPSGFAADILML
jgi:hypothetical protein